MLLRHREGVAQYKQLLFNEVSPEQGTFIHHSLEHKGHIFFFKSNAQEPGDLQMSTWDVYDNELVSSFLVFESVHNGEVDAYALSERLVRRPLRLMRLLVVCSRGGFLTSSPGVNVHAVRGGPTGSLTMKWLDGRTCSSLATYLAHVVELRLWKEFWVRVGTNIPDPRYPPPANRVESLVEQEKRRILNEEFEKEVKQLRANKDQSSCPSPFARASKAELVECFVSMSIQKKVRVLCGSLKQRVRKACLRRGEDKQYPVMFPAPILEPAPKIWMSRLLVVLARTKVKEVEHLTNLAALVEMFQDATKFIMRMKTMSAEDIVSSLFMLSLEDSVSSCASIALVAGANLVDVFASSLRAMLVAHIDSSNGAKKKKKKKKKNKKKGKNKNAASANKTEDEPVAPVVAVAAVVEESPSEQIPIVKETLMPPVLPPPAATTNPTTKTGRRRATSVAEVSLEDVSTRGKSDTGAKVSESPTSQKSLSNPQSVVVSPARERRKSRRSREPKGNTTTTGDFHRRKSEESISFVIKEPPSFTKPKSTEVSTAPSPRDADPEEVQKAATAAAAAAVIVPAGIVVIPASVMPPPPRDTVPLSRVRSGSTSEQSPPRLVPTASPFKLRSRTTDFMWRREEGPSVRNTESTTLRSHLSSVLDLQPSAKTLVLTKEIYMMVKHLEAQVAAQRPYREMAISKIRSIVRGLWPQARIEVFGSYATDLCLPSSDIDIVVVGAPSGAMGEAPGQQPLGILTKEFILNHTKWFSKVQAIPTARIPIIKLIYRSRNDALGALGDIPVDITFTSESNKLHSGVAARELVKQLVIDYRELKPLAFILKMFLHQRGLSNLFSGGISSYCLVLMIATFLGAFGLDARDKNVGALLLDFLELFGKKFDFSRTGISMSSASFFELSPQFAGRVPLWIDDPLNPGQNIGFNSFAMYRVKASFEMAFQTLNLPYSYASVRSYLGRILSDSAPDLKGNNGGVVTTHGQGVTMHQPASSREEELRRSFGGASENYDSSDDEPRPYFHASIDHHSDDGDSPAHLYVHTMNRNQNNHSNNNNNNVAATQQPVARKGRSLTGTSSMVHVNVVNVEAPQRPKHSQSLLMSSETDAEEDEEDQHHALHQRAAAQKPAATSVPSMKRQSSLPSMEGVAATVRLGTGADSTSPLSVSSKSISNVPFDHGEGRSRRRLRIGEDAAGEDDERKEFNYDDEGAVDSGLESTATTTAATTTTATSSLATKSALEPAQLLQQFAQHDEMEKLLRANLLEEKSRNERLANELRLKNESISELERKVDLQQQEMERMRKLLLSFQEKK